MSLDEKIWFGKDGDDGNFREDHVRQFIKELKEKLCTCQIDNITNKIFVPCFKCQEINELAGKGLI